MERLGNAVMKCLEVVIVGLISVMSILVIVNVALRFFFSSSIVVSEELSRFMFIYIVFLGSIVALKEDGHIYVDFIAKAFPRPIQWVLKLVVNCCMLYCCYVLLLGSVELSDDHIALRDDKEVETRSIGEEPLRRVLVCPVGGQRRERGRRPQRRSSSKFN